MIQCPMCHGHASPRCGYLGGFECAECAWQGSPSGKLAKSFSDGFDGHDWPSWRVVRVQPAMLDSMLRRHDSKQKYVLSVDRNGDGRNAVVFAAPTWQKIVHWAVSVDRPDGRRRAEHAIFTGKFGDLLCRALALRNLSQSLASETWSWGRLPVLEHEAACLNAIYNGKPEPKMPDLPNSGLSSHARGPRGELVFEWHRGLCQTPGFALLSPAWKSN